MTRKRIIVPAVLGILLAAAFLVFRQSPPGVALLKSKSHFSVHPADARVLYEPGAEDAAAQIAEYLPEATSRIEAGHHRPFKKSFKVYVCATQKSHNEYTGVRTPYPIRGTAVLGSVFIAPSAFDFRGRDTHRETLVHELSHLHMAQWLGFFGIRRPPNWFKEGLADHLARLGGGGVTDAEAIDAIRSGRRFLLREKGGLWNPLSKTIAAAGLEPVMYHQQVKMFVDFAAERDPAAFEGIVGDVLDGETVESAVAERTGFALEDLWAEFESGVDAREDE